MQNKPILLFVDATVRAQETSRTARLCRAYIDSFLKTHPDYKLLHRSLREDRLLANTLDDITRRDSLCEKGEISSPELALAAEFAKADHILIGAPYWDLSFPAMLKIYLEKVCVAGLTFAYTEQGIKPLCRAKCMTYLTTCGGKLLPELNLGADYLRALCGSMFGIHTFETEAAEFLDVDGFDAEAAMQIACARVQVLARNKQ